jgi:hypothetical protein
MASPAAYLAATGVSLWPATGKLLPFAALADAASAHPGERRRIAGSGSHFNEKEPMIDALNPELSSMLPVYWPVGGGGDGLDHLVRAWPYGD